MKCQVCGNESGKYPLCRSCNLQKEAGKIIKCSVCGKWHYRDQPCLIQKDYSADDYLYDLKVSLLSNCEKNFFTAIKSVLPEGYFIFPQINLATFIKRTDNARFCNELFRNVDFLITDADFCPKIAVEINDHTHLTPERRERDEKVGKICEEAGIPILKLWTSYGINEEYIKGRISEMLSSPPVKRIKHSRSAEQPIEFPQPADLRPHETTRRGSRKNGCYVATCVYGSYDCPQVWTLRRFRDRFMKKKMLGRAFIRVYYAVSPIIVKLFGSFGWFNGLFRALLDRLVRKLNDGGIEPAPYTDEQ